MFKSIIGKSKKSFHNGFGFTLIELLVVISIIGILSGVTMLIINPTRIQNRSKNAAIKSTLSKLSYATNGARAALGSVPSNTTILSEFEGVTSKTCTAGNLLNCTFSVGASALPSTCSSEYAGTGENPCYFRIFSVSTGYIDLTNAKFRVVAKKFKLDSTDADQVYVMDSSLGLKVCGASDAIESATLPVTCVNED